MIPNSNIKDESFGVDGMHNHNITLSNSNPFAAGILDQTSFPVDALQQRHQVQTSPVKVRARSLFNTSRSTSF
jgi:hypothetical protein